ncbi:hypothetical protein [Streptomyces sp. NPDC047990]|uniref:hypothetical protein n=1 Tax=Streptomyces sp. NPDC047990 TaxID=3365496 RepID=UPI003720434A
MRHRKTFDIKSLFKRKRSHKLMELVPVSVRALEPVDVVDAEAVEMTGWQSADGFGSWDTHPATRATERTMPFLDEYHDKYDRGEPLEAVAMDFLADLFLMLEAHNEDPEAIVRSAFMHYEAEANSTPVFEIV